MIFTETNIKGAFVIEVKRLQDERGFFGRSFCTKELTDHGINPVMVQANVSSNYKKGTLRGMHMQTAPYSEAKLVRCTRGAIFDVMVDMREGSPTRYQWVGEELTAGNFKMLYIPEGFAHGYLTLEDDTDVMYQVSQYYTPHAEIGFMWDDPAFNIRWPIQPAVISEKDRKHAYVKPVE